jgi:hypothetical protein
VSKLFYFLGVFLAKTLQDNRLVDLPLSTPFLKLLCQGEVSTAVKQRARITRYAARRGSPHPAEEDPMTMSTMYQSYKSFSSSSPT